jgi:serine/threonine protein kinase
VIRSRRSTDEGLLLEYAAHGNLYDYVVENPEISCEQRLQLCLEIAEGVPYLHRRSIIHCEL